MILKNKKLLIGVAAVAALLLVFNIVGKDRVEEWRVKMHIKNNPEWLADYDKIKGLIERDKQEPNDVGRLFTLGLAWKSLGEKTRDPFFFEKSLAVYERGAEHFGGRNVLFYWNAGKVAEELGRYEDAEKHYLKSIKLADGYAEGYQHLTDLYIYKLKKHKEEILQVFAQGIKTLFDPLPLIALRAAYLRRIGDDAAALPDYQLLAKNFPNNQAFQEVINELTQRLGE